VVIGCIGLEISGRGIGWEVSGVDAAHCCWFCECNTFTLNHPYQHSIIKGFFGDFGGKP
jgi:hypothetical protein